MPKNVLEGPQVGTPSSAWRFRIDTWDFLSYAAKQLVTPAPGGGAGIHLHSEIRRLLQLLEAIEPYWAFPGLQQVTDLRHKMEAGEYKDAFEIVEAVKRGIKRSPHSIEEGNALIPEEGEQAATGDETSRTRPKPRFEVLVIDDCPPEESEALRAEMRRQRRQGDFFEYEVNVVPSFEDALVAVLLNPDIQACIIRPGFCTASRHPLGLDLRKFLAAFAGEDLDPLRPIQRILMLADKLAELRPELDLYLVAGVAIEKLAGSLTRRFRRIFLRADSLELHLSLLRGINDRYETPFFTALQSHSRKPAGVFHALPLSRGGSVVNSKWISDMGEFYGLNLFLAETSATSGGLDSLLDPHGSIKEAQTLAARAFGAQKSFFVTNGTSTANKIVHQSIVKPGDVVLVDRNCHKSHHYALMLAGARVAYLDSYPLDEYSFYGAVPLSGIKKMLLDYRRAGRLDQVKMIALTNCTFDGIVYDVERVMSECLAIKPDLVFLWDEAWFAFAGFHPVYRRRTAMTSARKLEALFGDPDYAAQYEQQRGALFDPETNAPVNDDLWLASRLLPDPQQARLRVYATQSTHKTLTSLRQGSMIHVYDQDFSRLNEEAFREAYMTHTSTSPNYQILASLDIGRRQAEFEGFELVQKQADLAISITEAVSQHRLLKKYFRILSTADLVPGHYRETSYENPLQEGLAAMDEAWRKDEFVVDPSRLTLYIGLTGIDGDTFKHTHLMDRFGIQINKTSRNSVLFMTNIGTSRSSVAYLIEVLVKLAEALEEEQRALSPRATGARETRVLKLTTAPPALPDFSHFAERYRCHPETPDGDLRAAFFDTYETGASEYLSATDIGQRLVAGEEVISAGFVTPYPPGFPILVPGQTITPGILDFMSALDTREIHGYDHEFGFRVMTPESTKDLGED